MTPSVEAALEDLGASVPEPSDARLKQRLHDVESLLGDDLIWVEQAMSQAATQGPSPATDAARHLISRGGKRVRPVALLLSAACFGPIPAVARELSIVTELLHSATLLHDDVNDEGMERRGAPTARLLYGNAVSVLAGDLCLVQALERTLAHAPALMAELVATIRALVHGEIIQLRGRRTLDVSEQTYEAILRGKTASLFAWATSTGAHLAGASSHDQRRLRAFGERIGIAFQLVDDVLDYSGERTGKTLLSDLKEGKLTLPLVLTVAAQPELLELLRRIHAGDQEPVELVSRRVIESGSCEVVRRRAQRLTEEAVRQLEELPPSAARHLLQDVAVQLSLRAV